MGQNSGRVVLYLLCAALLLGCGNQSNANASPADRSANFSLPVTPPFQFVVLGDTRFHDPSDTTAANAKVRQALVAAIDKQRPAFISITGDVVYAGAGDSDWRVWDKETAAWQQHHIPIFPALGNHDLKGGEAALSNYFGRFPQLERRRYYTLGFGNCLMLVLDSSLDETSGIQGEWLQQEFDHLPDSVAFVFVMLHHPPYTSSSDLKLVGGGHSARTKEGDLARFLENRQQQLHARIIVLAGHVHNFEHHQHGGIDYLVTGGGGAPPYLIARRSSDLFQSTEVNYHYLLVDVSADRVVISMNRLEFANDQEIWTQPETVTIKAK